MINVIKTIENEKFYSPEDLAKKFRVSLSSVYKLMRKGGLPYIRLGKVYRVPVSELEAYLARQSGNFVKREGVIAKDIAVLQHFLSHMRQSSLKEEILEIWLYGSYARGDTDVNSDVDLLVILRERGLGTSRQLSEVCEKAMESVDYQDLISPMELSEEEWALMKKNKYLLAQTILEEGMLIWKSR